MFVDPCPRYFSGALRWKSISFAKQSGRLPQHRGVMESDGCPPLTIPGSKGTKHNYSSCQHCGIHHLQLSVAKGSVPRHLEQDKESVRVHACACWGDILIDECLGENDAACLIPKFMAFFIFKGAFAHMLLLPCR